MNAKESIVFMFKGGFKLGTLLAVSFWEGVLNRVPSWQFHFGREGGFELGTLLAVLFWEGGTSGGRSEKCKVYG